MTTFRLISLLWLSIALSMPVAGQAAAIPRSPTAPASIKPFTQPQLLELLKREGYGGVQPINQNGIRFKFDGYNATLIIYEERGISLVFYVSDIPYFTLSDVNEWNASKRLSRAYIDRDGDLALESDLQYTDNTNEAPVLMFLRSFQVSVRVLINTIVEKQNATKSGPKP